MTKIRKRKLTCCGFNFQQWIFYLFLWILQISHAYATDYTSLFGKTLYFYPPISSRYHHKMMSFIPRHNHKEYSEKNSVQLPEVKVTRNVTAQLGQTVFLHCIVNHLGDKTVSWIRRRDFLVLTIGHETYTTDQRFQAVHLPKTKDWALQIRYAHLKDNGLYECQISSDPKISHFVYLTVLEAKAEILGHNPLYVKTGSRINMTCVISQSPELPAFVFWYQNSRMINYDTSRGQITLRKSTKGRTISTMVINSADITDSGNYTCCPSNAEPVSILVYVIYDEQPAAIQHDAKIVETDEATKLRTNLICLLAIVSCYLNS